jgi:hypothetical protein
MVDVRSRGSGRAVSSTQVNVVRGLSRARIVLVVLLAAYVVADILLTPLAGLETRNPSFVTPLGVVALGLLFLGLLLAIVSGVMIFRGSRLAFAVAVIAAVLFLPAPITEWTGRFSALRPPPAIAILEVIQTFIAVLVIVAAGTASRARSAT